MSDETQKLADLPADDPPATGSSIAAAPKSSTETSSSSAADGADNTPPSPSSAAVPSNAPTTSESVSTSEPAEGESAVEEESPRSNEILEEDIYVESEDESEDEPVTSDGAIEEVGDDDPADEEFSMDWYILKVQSNRERSIAEALERKIAVEGLDRYFGQVVVPTEKVTEFKAGKKRIVERKLYPGYIVVNMHINDDTWFAVRETSGIGDFTGAAGRPTPMLPQEVARIVKSEEEETTEQPKLDIRFKVGEKVKIKEGNFESFEGEVSGVDEASGRVTVMINIFGRSTPVQLDYWSLESV